MRSERWDRNTVNTEVFQERPFSIEFLNHNKYQIVDSNSNTVVATRVMTTIKV